MKYLLASISICLSFAFLNYGSYMGERYSWVNTSESCGTFDYRGNTGEAATLAIGGPILGIPWMLRTNFYRSGFIWLKPRPDSVCLEKRRVRDSIEVASQAIIYSGPEFAYGCDCGDVRDSFEVQYLRALRKAYP